jgi:serine protease AprX
MKGPQLSTALVWLLSGLVAASPAAAGPGRGDGVPARSPWFKKLDRNLQAAIERNDRSGRKTRVIIRTRAGAQTGLAASLGRKAKVFNPFAMDLVGGVPVEIAQDELEKLAANPDIEGISIDAPVQAQQAASDPCSTLATGWGTACGDASSQYWVMHGSMGYRSSNWDGSDIGVAVIDSGVAASDDLRVTASYDFQTGLALPVFPSDPYGHGTHVAGLIASSGKHSAGYYQGVAPGARIISLRVLDKNGAGSTSSVIKAVEFAVANRNSLGIHIINLSLGHPIYEPAASDPLVLAVESAVRAGIVVVVSAGNNGVDSAGVVGYAGISSPGNAPSAITVGTYDHKNTARRDDDTVAPYSSRGPTWYDGFAKPDVLAPGHRVVAPVPSSSKLYQTLSSSRVTPPGLSPTPHLRLSGTSMSTAVVSGVVAAMLEVDVLTFNKKVSPNAIKAMLQATALPLQGPDKLTQGNGTLNMLGALRVARRANPWTPIGQMWLTGYLENTTAIEGVPVTWASHVVWGDHIVWGDGLLYNQALWDNHVVWGDAVPWIGSIAVDANHIVWGDTAVWVNHIVWGDNVLGIVDGNHIVWGDANVNALNALWGDLSQGNHIVWGDSLLNGLSAEVDDTLDGVTSTLGGLLPVQ